MLAATCDYSDTGRDQVRIAISECDKCSGGTEQLRDGNECDAKTGAAGGRGVKRQYRVIGRSERQKAKIKLISVCLIWP